MRNYQYEFDARVDFIRSLLSKSGAAGIVYGNSGGKDSALVGILCKAACEDSAKQKIRQMHEKSEHKRKGIILYPVETLIL